MLEEEDFIEAEVTMSPPGDGQNSDEDSDAEDGCQPDHLNAAQLTAAAEFRINYGSQVVNSLDTDDGNSCETSDDEIDGLTENVLEVVHPPDVITEEGSSSARPTVNDDSLTAAEPPATQHTWLKKDLPAKSFNSKPSLRVPKEPLSPVAIFIAFFADETMEYMVRMTNTYARRDKGKHTFTTDVNEIRLFLAMLLLTGYVRKIPTMS